MIVGRNLVKMFSQKESIEEIYERAFSEGYEYAQREFAEEEEKRERKKVHLSDVDSHKGLKRAILTALPTGGGSLVGGYLAKQKAEDLDAAGADDRTILREAKKHGGKIGAITGALSGVGAGLSSAARGGSAAGAALSGLAGAGLGYIGGSLAAKVNTKHRLEKRAMEERRLNGEDR